MNVKIELSSGRTISPNRSIIGIDEEGRLWDGYDNGLSADLGDDLQEDDRLTTEERAEIARMVIARWAKLLPGKVVALVDHGLLDRFRELDAAAERQRLHDLGGQSWDAFDQQRDVAGWAVASSLEEVGRGST